MMPSARRRPARPSSRRASRAGTGASSACRRRPAARGPPAASARASAVGLARASARSAASARRSARSGARPPRGAPAGCGGPRVTISRNGRMSSGRSGPPKAISSTESTPVIARTARGRCRRARCTCSTGVSLWMPWPRLKTWPGPARRRVEDLAGPRGGSRARSASSTAGSRLPCTATSWPSRAHVGPELHAPVEPDHVAARLLHRAAAAPPVPVPKWMTGTPGAQRADHARAMCGST